MTALGAALRRPLRPLLALHGWLACTEGSTRSLALIRMGLIAVIWARWAEHFILFRHLGREHDMALGVLFYLATTASFVGLFTRTATAITAALCGYLVYYVGMQLGHEPFTHHHTRLLAWASLFLALSPSGKSYSLDRWFALARAERNGSAAPPERANLWGMRLMALQVASIYFWGAYDKSNVGFLSGDRMQHYLMYHYTGSTPLADLLPGADVLAMLAAVSTVALEYALAFGLFFRRGRRWLVLPGLALHALFYATLSVFTYTATIWVLYLAFFDADRVHAAIDRLGGSAPRDPQGPQTASSIRSINPSWRASRPPSDR